MTWAALIKSVYEVDPLKCPKCGGVMKIVSFIEEDAMIERILRHCKLWKDLPLRGPPVEKPPPEPEEAPLDYGFTSARLSAPLRSRMRLKRPTS
jgi:hypothetical protein